MFKLNSKKNIKKKKRFSFFENKKELANIYILHNCYKKKLHLGMSINAMVGLWAVPTEF